MRQWRTPGDRRRILLSWFALPLSLVVALLLGAVMMLAPGCQPDHRLQRVIVGGIRRQLALGSTAVKAAPLLLVAVGICVAFRANVFNIGGEGQLAMGGLASSATALALPNLPSIELIPLVLVAGAAGGGAWGAIPGAFKAYFNVNEILSTIMLNLVAVQVMNWLLAGPMVDKTQNSTYGLIPETRLLPGPPGSPSSYQHAAPPRCADRRDRRLWACGSCSTAQASASASKRWGCP